MKVHRTRENVRTEPTDSYRDRVHHDGLLDVMKDGGRMCCPCLSMQIDAAVVELERQDATEGGFDDDR